MEFIRVLVLLGSEQFYWSGITMHAHPNAAKIAAKPRPRLACFANMTSSMVTRIVDHGCRRTTDIRVCHPLTAFKLCLMKEAHCPFTTFEIAASKEDQFYQPAKLRCKEIAIAFETR